MSLNESRSHSREFMLKAVERLEAGERASALAIELTLNRTDTGGEFAGLPACINYRGKSDRHHGPKSDNPSNIFLIFSTGTHTCRSALAPS